MSSNIQWSKKTLADVQANLVCQKGNEGVSAADALQARSEAYQAGKSHGAERFFKCIFSLGFNELWRFANYLSYESDKAKIVDSVKNVYNALAPKLGPTDITVMFHEEGGVRVGNMHQDSLITSKPYVGQKTDNVKLVETKATIERDAKGGGCISINEGRGREKQIYLTDCDQLRRNLEISIARDAKHFGKDFVMDILNRYKESATAPGNSDAGKLHFADKDHRGKVAVRRFPKEGLLYLAKTDKQREEVEANLQDQTVKSAARAHLKSMLSAFYSAQLDLPKDVGDTIGLELGVDLAGKVMDGEITDGRKLLAFLDKGSKGCHLTTVEGQKVMAQFEAAVDAKDASVNNIRIAAPALAPKNPRPTLPQGEVKKLHDFVADLVVNEENTEYDKSLDTGKLTGLRLRTLVVRNRELVASLMEKNGAALDAALKTLEPRMAGVLKNSVIAPLEGKYQAYVTERKRNEEEPRSRAEWLKANVKSSQERAAQLRVTLGVRNEDEIANAPLDSLTQDKDVRKTLEAGGADFKDELYVSSRAGRDQIALGLDFFGEKEKEIQTAVADALKDVQAKIVARLDQAFGQDASAAVNKTADQLGTMNLDQMMAAYSKDSDITLIKNTLKTYFKDIGPLQQRQMLAAQTRFCAEIPGETTDGARLGALLKGAGPVMQKMLQGIDVGQLRDEDLKLALADMKDSLAPIPDNVIKAHLFDLMKNSEDPKITSINVKASLGQASVGQALLCSVKRDGQMAEDCVVKILRPNASLAAQREYDVFLAACGNDESMKAMFEERFKSIEEELDLTVEVRNMEIADKTYAYKKDIPEIGTFTNTTSASLFTGVKPTPSVMMQKKVEGTTVKKFLDETTDRLTSKKTIPNGDLEKLRDKLVKTHSALVSTSYMWANEGLFGSGFYHGDLHAGNLMVDDEGKITMIDFGNATQLDKAGRTNVTRIITGAAVGDVDIFLKGYEAMLGSTGRANFNANKGEIKAKLAQVFSHTGLVDTPKRLNIAIKMLQIDHQIEVPGAVHNFLESQKRLAATMDQTASLLNEVNKKLGVKVEKQPKSMMDCLVCVVRNNITLNLMKTVGLGNAKGVYNSIKYDQLLNKPNGDEVIIKP